MRKKLKSNIAYSKTARAAALLSGGLDSLLATKIILQQGIEVEGINFAIGFGDKKNPAIACAKQLGIKLHLFDVVDEFKQIVLNPRYGYGKNLNPCLDCKIFMLRKTMAIIKDYGFDFLITGEVIGQRPKSQLRNKMQIIIKESGVLNLLLRPLCAKCLPITLPEQEGWVDRNSLYNFNGRSRKPQIELAKQLGLDNYPQPAGGCLLTDGAFCNKMRHLWQYRNKKDYSRDDIELLRIGRHIAPNKKYKIIVGRNETENEALAKFCNTFSSLLSTSHLGPLVILDGVFDSADINLAGRIAARYSAGRCEEQVQIQVRLTDGTKYSLQVTPLAPQDILPEWFV